MVTIQAILREQRLWANLQPDVKMLRARSDIGRAHTRDEGSRLLAACQKSRSRGLYPTVLLSTHSGLRNQELSLLRWQQVDMLECCVVVGRSKAQSGEGRVVPLSDTTIMTLAGHLSVKMKEKYSHTRQEAKRQAITILGPPAVPTVQWGKLNQGVHKFPHSPGNGIRQGDVIY